MTEAERRRRKLLKRAFATTDCGVDNLPPVTISDINRLLNQAAKVRAYQRRAPERGLLADLVA